MCYLFSYGAGRWCSLKDMTPVAKCSGSVLTLQLRRWALGILQIYDTCSEVAKCSGYLLTLQLRRWVLVLLTLCGSAPGVSTCLHGTQFRSFMAVTYESRTTFRFRFFYGGFSEEVLIEVFCGVVWSQIHAKVLSKCLYCVVTAVGQPFDNRSTYLRLLDLFLKGNTWHA